MQLKATIQAVILSLSLVPAFAQARSVNDEIRVLRNIVNNSVPERQRDQLNRAIDRLEDAAAGQCRRDDRDDRDEDSADVGDCEIQFSGSMTRVIRDGQAVSTYTSTLSDSTNYLNRLRREGLCR